ncbi:hypothetical protein T492DRAFT_872023 [Pavlovales sp. CCMP2436]|nr:hypothetical protein T492DRAFT_872023 [Pavlovales sp. CCMP2436]
MALARTTAKPAKLPVNANYKSADDLAALEQAVDFCQQQAAEQAMSRRRALDGGKKGGSKNLKAAAARLARQAAGVSKYAPSELEAEDVGVLHVVDLVLDEVVMDKALAAKRALSAA